MSAGEQVFAQWIGGELGDAYLFPYMSSAWRPEICRIRCCGGCRERLSQRNPKARFAGEEPGWPKLPLHESMDACSHPTVVWTNPSPLINILSGLPTTPDSQPHQSLHYNYLSIVYM